METLKEILIDQLKDIFSAEIQLKEALPKAAQACVTAELKAAFTRHRAETEVQIRRLDRLGNYFGQRLDAATCQAMEGLLKEAAAIIDADYEYEELRDAMLIAIGQKIEHYEIAAYGNALAIAEHLELDTVTALLHASLTEEKSADRVLSEICKEFVFPACDQEYEANAVMDNEALRTRT